MYEAIMKGTIPLGGEETTILAGGKGMRTTGLTYMSHPSSCILCPKSSKPYCPTLPWPSLWTTFAAQGAMAICISELSWGACCEYMEWRWQSTWLWRSYCAHIQGQCCHGITHGSSAPICYHRSHDTMDSRRWVKLSVLPGGPTIAACIWSSSHRQHLWCHMVDLQWR